MLGLSFRVSNGVHDLFQDFAAYSEMTPSQLFVMLADEQRALSHGMDELEFINHYAAINQQLPAKQTGSKKSLLRAHVSPDIVHDYETEATRLSLATSYVAKVAVLHGLLDEMRSENFTF